MNHTFWRRFCRNKAALLGLAVLAAVAVLALFGPWLAGNDPWEMAQQPFLHPLQQPGFALGTDTMGRDILSGVIHGARISLLIGLVSTVVSLAIGVTLGALSGYFGGWVDAALMRFTELFLYRAQLRAGAGAGGHLRALHRLHRDGHRGGLPAAGGAPYAQRVPDPAPARSLPPRGWPANRRRASSSRRSCPTPLRPSW